MLQKRRWGEHLSDDAKGALSRAKAYLPAATLLNPLTRNVVRRIANDTWAQTIDEIDFEFTITDEMIGDVPCARYRTFRTRPEAPLIFYLHAGGYVAGSPHVNAAAVLPACHLSGCEAIAIDYSLAPEFRHPTQHQEIERVYRSLLAAGRSPRRIVFVGDSAGGGLALSSIHWLKAAGLPAPAGAALIAAFLDASAASDTHISLAGRDPIFGSGSRRGAALTGRLLAPDLDLKHPDISPLYADLTGFPPLLLQVGSRDSLLGDSARLAEKARQQGVPVTLRVFDGMFHLFHMYWSLEEAVAAQTALAAFIAEVCPGEAP